MKQNVVGKTGVFVTQIGLGTGPLGGLYRESPRDQAFDVMNTAWDRGIRYFDTAPFYGYGLAERRTGDFLQGKPSDEWTLSTKVGRLLRRSDGPGDTMVDFVNALKFGVQFDYSYDGIMRSIEDSYARLGLTKIDIAYVHDIGDFVHPPEETKHHMEQLLGGGLKALDQLKSNGAIGAFGIGVNEVDICLRMLDATDLDCILLAGRHTLLDRSAEAELLPICRDRGVSIIAGGIVNSGILATGAVDGAYFDYAPANHDVLGRVRSMEKLASAKGHPLLQAALSFPLGEASIKSLLLGVDNSELLNANLNMLANPLRAEELEDYSAFALTDHL